jgi:hypothetical protein
MHVEREADCVAGCEEVREAVDVGGDVMWFLGLEEWEEGLEGFREDEGSPRW